MERSRDEEAEEIIRRLKAPPKVIYRKYEIKWNLAAAADLQSVHGIDLEKEITDALSKSIAAEIDEELLRALRRPK